MLQRMEGFQSSTTEVEATIQNAALVLCNDKPQTFGAPDVLQVTASQASAQYTMSMFFPDRPPNQAVRIGLAISASFLNNSSSRWEAICESWAVEAEMVDTVSPIYRSDHHRYMAQFMLDNTLLCSAFWLHWRMMSTTKSAILPITGGNKRSCATCNKRSFATSFAT